MVLKAWEGDRTFVHITKIRISCIKSDIGPKIIKLKNFSSGSQNSSKLGSGSQKFIKTEVWVVKFTFLMIALNRLLTLPDYSIGLELLISSGIIDFENKNISVVTKHWKYRISVPMLYITFMHKVQK